MKGRNGTTRPDSLNSTGLHLRAFLLAATVGLLSACGGGDDGDHGARVDLEKGMEFLQIFDFSAAYDHLEEARADLEPGSKNWVRATYALALAGWHRSPPQKVFLDEAQSLLRSVIEAVPADAEVRALALMDLGRIIEVQDSIDDTTDVEGALAYYRQVREEFPGTQFSARAAMYEAQAIEQLQGEDGADEIVRLLTQEIENQTDDAWISVLAQYLAHISLTLEEEPKSALPYLLLAREKGYARESQADRHLYQTAQVAEAVGEDLIAAEVYAEILTDYPRSAYGTVSRNHLLEIAAAHPEANLEVPDVAEVNIGR